MSISELEGLLGGGGGGSTVTLMNSTCRCSSRCPSRCAIHYGYRAWTFPNSRGFDRTFLGRSRRFQATVLKFPLKEGSSMGVSESLPVGQPLSESPKTAGKMVPRENCRKVSKSFLTLFDDFGRFLPCAKIVEKCRKTF